MFCIKFLRITGFLIFLVESKICESNKCLLSKVLQRNRINGVNINRQQRQGKRHWSLFYFSFLFIESRFFFHIIHPGQFPLPSPPPPRSSLPPLCSISIQKEVGLQETRLNTTKQDIVRQVKSLLIKAQPGNPRGEKESQLQAKESEALLLPWSNFRLW